MISLDFNCSQMHDSSPRIAPGNEIVFAIEGERISRINDDANFSDNANWVRLEFAKVSPDEIDFIWQGWPTPAKMFETDVKCFTRGQYSIAYINVLKSAWLLR